MADLFLTAFADNGERLIDKAKVRNFASGYSRAEEVNAASLILHRVGGKILERAFRVPSGKWNVKQPHER